MKGGLLALLSVFHLCITADGQAVNPAQKILVVYENKPTGISVNATGGLIVNIDPDDVKKFTTLGIVRYSDLGAQGDGKTDDMDAIAATHAFANQHHLTVRADDKATYYIGGNDRTALIRTHTDFGTASFMIDDRDIQNRNTAIFTVGSDLQSFPLKEILSLKKNQQKIRLSLPGPCLITVTNSDIKQYIRLGLNQNNGSAQTDIFLVDKNGNVDMNAPIIWDFDRVTEARALPIDEKPLYINGGRFTTIVSTKDSTTRYCNRNLAIRRSNVIVQGLTHFVTGEGSYGAPYSGFINIGDCANVTIKKTVLTGHKTFSKIGTAGKPVAMGTYDIIINRAVNVSFISCRQTNDINDPVYWGIMGSNFCKNLLMDSCIFSRFDAHQGVANATIRNSTLGHMGINAIGSGIFTVENSTILGRSLINLRPDYGSTWQGEFIIRNCVFKPANGKKAPAVLFSGSNSGQHDFGYTSYMPARITIEDLRIDDSNHPENYQGPVIFSDFNPEMIADTYKEKFPYLRTKNVVLKNVTVASGRSLRVSDNRFMFKDVVISNN